MIKIHTPSQWYSLFRTAELIIEDDGMIYRDEDQYKSFRQAVGKIDYAAGMIYGEDYFKWGAQPIGAIKKDGDVTRVYGEDYYRSFAQPIFYIRDNRVYSSDEFYKTFPSEAAYISGDFGGSTAQGTTASGNSFTGTDTVSYSGGSTESESRHPILNFLGWVWDKGFWGFVTVVFGLAIVASALIAPFWIMAGQEGTEMAEMLIMGLGFGAFMAFFTAQSWEEMVIKTILFSILGIFALDVSNAYKEGDLEVVELILAAIFGIFIYGLTVLVPSVIIGSILWFIKRPFVKKKKEKETK